ncbi:uncharacterized protein F5891DRAFT_1278802 [Suillus fuscotomentosus]|uniref:Uncharacterized protein n=1 Tax=Suillus fuscotomentosus TaxID=1912939 RepID=A0AAD4E6R3_9AGAM|nr:uncharacterized protein F5891DRAFT_1278802 [Suillus fuscotomentosus]KAG1899464.1 hypothetical protein F5891DRAFT_1278802 [Suillus fuscotomentosus]
MRCPSFIPARCTGEECLEQERINLENSSLRKFLSFIRSIVCLDDHSPNHKEFPAIIKELEDATGIDARALICFRPGMNNARQRLQWVSSRVTRLQEDIAEKKQNALGQLLQEIVARSGDITILDWVRQPSESNSCLPVYISSHAIPSRTLPSYCRLHLPCTAFRVTEVTLSYNPSQETRCEVKADVLRDL